MPQKGEGLPGFWLELRPLSTAKLKPRNLSCILNSLYASGKPFRFLVHGGESHSVSGKESVRFFLELPSQERKRYVAGVLKAALDVEVLDNAPPQLVYDRGISLEMSRHYALPVHPFDADSEDNPVDRLVEAVACGVRGFEVTARGDPGARLGMQSFIYARTYPRSSFSNILTRTVLGILGQASVQREAKHVSERARRPQVTDPQRRIDVEAAVKKMNTNLFTCEIRTYGDPEGIRMIVEALPSAQNRFKRFRTRRHAAVPGRMAAPIRSGLMNLLSHSWRVAPIVLIGLAYYLGVFSPLRLLESLGREDVMVVVAAASVAFSLMIAFRRRKPIVLSAEELSLVVGLPTSVGRLPVEYGATPPSRKALAVPRGSEVTI